MADNKNKSSNKNNNKKKNQKKNNFVLPIAAAVVIVIAVICIAVPNLTGNKEDTQTTQSQSAAAVSSASDIVIDESSVSENATFYDFDANGVTVELFAVRASDGTVRLALNTCQVCNGSPYAYFVQQGDNFICQNCKNAFQRDSIGQVHGGCNPVPITEGDYQISDGKITVFADFLQQNASSFVNWKKF
ncbi:MAG: DUF2318 domain-containing protein [Acutalibacteraceae bacterium]